MANPLVALMGRGPDIAGNYAAGVQTRRNALLTDMLPQQLDLKRRQQEMDMAASGRKQAQEGFDQLARYAKFLKGVPPEQRAQVFQSRIAPQLQRMGFDEQAMQIGPDDLTDQGLDAFIARSSEYAKLTDRPNSYDEFMAAQQNPQYGSWLDRQNASKGTNVNVAVNTGTRSDRWGTAPKDMVWLRDDAGNVITEPDPSGRGVRPVAVPISGSGPAEERANAARARAEAARQGTINAEGVLSTIARARSKAEGSNWTTGLKGSIMQAVPGTDAYDLRSLLETVRANIGFDRLQQMREASPTGGALGQVTERELSNLQATIANLEQSQSREQFMQNLLEVEKRYREIIRKFAAYPNAADYGFGGGQQRGGGGGGAKIRIDTEGNIIE